MSDIQDELDRIADIREENERAQRDEVARTEASRAEARRQEAERTEAPRRPRAAIAAELGATDPAYLAEALGIHRPFGVHLQAIWDRLAQLTHSRPDVAAAIEARHCLGGVGPFKPVPGEHPGLPFDRTALPPVVTPPLTDWWHQWFASWLADVGLTYPSLDDDGETLEAAMTRIEKARRAKFYAPDDSSENDIIAARELRLFSELRKSLDRRAERELHATVAKMQGRVVRIVDESLAALELGPTWWWVRELRRALAGETPTIALSPTEFTSWRFTQALGVRFSFSFFPVQEF